MFPIPANLPVLLGERLSEGQQNLLSRILSGQTDSLKALTDLSKYWKIKVWFKQPVSIVVNKRWKNGITEHVFNKIALSTGGSLMYADRSTSRQGYLFDFVDHVDRYEPVPHVETQSTFASLDAFKKKFDPRFITEDQIVKLYNEKSAQTGERYTKADFKSIGPQGREVVEKFMYFFKGLNEGENAPGYHQWTDDKIVHWNMRQYYHSNSSNRSVGRDITISHTAGAPYIHYASEFPGCGNGTYGLLATEKTFLWLEND